MESFFKDERSVYLGSMQIRSPQHMRRSRIGPTVSVDTFQQYGGLNPILKSQYFTELLLNQFSGAVKKHLPALVRTLFIINGKN